MTAAFRHPFVRVLRNCLIAAAVIAPLNVGRHAHFYNEMGAMRTLTTIHTAEARYFSQFGNFAVSLKELASVDDTLSDVARTRNSHGYRFTLSRTARGYTIDANPIRLGAPGIRNFFSDQTLALHQHYGPEPATAADPLVK